MPILRLVVRVWRRATYRTGNLTLADFNQPKVSRGLDTMHHRRAHTL